MRLYGRLTVCPLYYRRRQRFLELLIDPRVRRVVWMRAQILSKLREHFAKNRYLEVCFHTCFLSNIPTPLHVSTPVLSSMVGGAGEVNPFETTYFDGKIKLNMRIAPELYLKAVLGQQHRLQLACFRCWLLVAWKESTRSVHNSATKASIERTVQSLLCASIIALMETT